MPSLRLPVALVGACLLFAPSCASHAPKPAAAAAVELSPLIGKPPPPIEVARWVRGEPLARFEPGKVYVVDFWATWCGPCKAAIPHLTRLAKEHDGRVEVIGVAISEKQKDEHDTEYIDKVARFVASQGERMDYRVAVDTPTKTMHATWFKPTGTGGIPTAYVIDQKGNVAWIGIGAPKDVERIVEAVLAGTYDPRKEAELQAQAEREAEERSARDIAAAKAESGKTDDRYPGYRAAMERGDTAAALASLNAAFRADPASETSGAYQWKLMLLLQGKDSRAAVEEYAKDLLARCRTNDDVVGFVSAIIVSTSEELRFDAALAYDAAELTAKQAKPDSRWQQFALWRLGWASFHTGKREQAIASVEKALANVERLKGTVEFEDLADGCNDALRVFKKAAK
ncbi:MAG: redoxin family protein [Planctomycetes bacterium]|nr:redoxin family protein [Planctomycetota bacterium]